VVNDPDASEGYVRYLKESSGDLSGLRLVVDGANGAAFSLAPRIFSELGATVTARSVSPDGVNINDNCGSMHPEAMAALVAEMGADAGMAFDGDADRVILADDKGRIFDGDRILCALGIWLKETGRLRNDVVVGTTMSNLGLEHAFAAKGIRLIRADVGDRYVSEQMKMHGAILGGEKSGHILLTDLSTTGDGILTALQILRLLQESGRRLSEWADEMSEYPQKLVSIKVREKIGWQSIPAIVAAIAEAEARLEGKGRLNVRPSGTEKKIRVMAEGPDSAEVEEVVALVAGAVEMTLGA
jgi:phosphoglucosamine mutase